MKKQIFIISNKGKINGSIIFTKAIFFGAEEALGWNVASELILGQGKHEIRAVRLRFIPDSSAMKFDDFLSEV